MLTDDIEIQSAKKCEFFEQKKLNQFMKNEKKNALHWESIHHFRLCIVIRLLKIDLTFIVFVVGAIAPRGKLLLKKTFSVLFCSF